MKIEKKQENDQSINVQFMFFVFYQFLRQQLQIRHSNNTNDLYHTCREERPQYFTLTHVLYMYI